jgi:DNA polymerase elongation subunit (family B)
MSNYLIIDIETMPSDESEIALQPFIRDLKGEFKRGAKKESTGLRGLMQEPDDKYSIALSKAALTPVAGRIACIGVIEFIPGDGMFKDESIAEYFFCDEDEKKILNDFNECISDHTLVTFNGRQFDFPFILFRSAILNVVTRELPIGKYNRNDGHIDLKIHLEELGMIDNLAGDAKMRSISLAKWIEYFSLPSKTLSPTGNVIKELTKSEEGRQKLKEYCVGIDCQNTLRIFKRFINTIPNGNVWD